MNYHANAGFPSTHAKLKKQLTFFTGGPFLFIRSQKKKGSSATNYRGEEFDSSRLISRQTTGILSVYAKSRHFGNSDVSSTVTEPTWPKK